MGQKCKVRFDTGNLGYKTAKKICAKSRILKWWFLVSQNSHHLQQWPSPIDSASHGCFSKKSLRFMSRNTHRCYFKDFPAFWSASRAGMSLAPRKGGNPMAQGQGYKPGEPKPPSQALRSFDGLPSLFWRGFIIRGNIWGMYYFDVFYKVFMSRQSKFKCREGSFMRRIDCAYPFLNLDWREIQKLWFFRWNTSFSRQSRFFHV